MRRPYRNDVYDRATGSAMREWKEMARLAVKIRQGRCSPVWADEQQKRFTGIFRRLLEDPINEVINEAGGDRYAERY